jgi:AcrR family transcriptional regulator
MNIRDITKDAILDAATQLFAAQGFDGASIRMITAAAGTNLGAITYHFGTKDALFEAVIARSVEPLVKRIGVLAGRSDAPLARLEEATRTLFDLLSTHPELPRLLVHVLAGDRPIPMAARALLERNHGVVSRIITEGQQDGSIRSGDPRLLALGVAALPIWLTLMRRPLSAAIGIDPEQPETRAALLEMAVSLVRAGFAAQPESSA